MAENGLKVLVVDDEEDLCDLACLWLEGLGYRPKGVLTGAAAEAALKEQRYDVLFTDVVMPGGMDGLTLARAASEKDPELRVLVASGYARNLFSGDEMPWVLLNKPYRKDNLRLAMEEVIAAPPVKLPPAPPSTHR